MRREVRLGGRWEGGRRVGLREGGRKEEGKVANISHLKM